MANLQVKNVPADLFRRIRRYARRRGRTLRDVVLDAVEREVARAEFHDRIAGRSAVRLDEPAARAVEETRSERDREIER
jgi:hypothetical protein